MRNIVGVVKIDKSGRIVLPAKVRKEIKAEKFELEIEGGVLKLKPIKDLDTLFGALPELDMKKIREEHEEEVRSEAL